MLLLLQLARMSPSQLLYIYTFVHRCDDEAALAGLNCGSCYLLFLYIQSFSPNYKCYLLLYCLIYRLEMLGFIPWKVERHIGSDCCLDIRWVATKIAHFF
jgi:hypothetical protein